MRRLALALLALSALPAAAQAPASPPPAIDRYVQQVMQMFEVPGIGVAIVKDGRVVLAKGYGVRRLGAAAPVDANTLFGIASNTKAFTATALGLLVEEGKLAWDAPVIDYLPGFQMWDPYVTRELTIRDLLVHRSGLGLGAGDLLWWPPSTYDRKEIARRLRWVRPATSFRSAYAYDNVLYNVAGEVIEAVSGLTWEAFVETRILQRVGMSGSNVRGALGGSGPNTATPHAPIDGQVRIVKPFASDIVNPAGGINASVADMAKWLIVQMDSGRLADGTRLFSPRTARELWTPVTPMPIGTSPPELAPLQAKFQSYGLGFNVRDFRGEKLVLHSGGLPGYVSRVAMIPDRKLGVVVLTNQEAGAAFDAIAYHVLDHYLGAPAFDWLAGFKASHARTEAAMAEAERRTAAARDSLSRPSLPLERYAGTYRDAWYGDVAIAHDVGRLTIRFLPTPWLVGDLVHWQYDTFVARWHDRELRADAFVTFSLAPDGTIEQARMRAVSPATDFSFDFHDLLLRPVRGPARAP
jgi:CubicO group peptidase (beta-lactamase class C family)